MAYKYKLIVDFYSDEELSIEAILKDTCLYDETFLGAINNCELIKEDYKEE